MVVRCENPMRVASVACFPMLFLLFFFLLFVVAAPPLGLCALCPFSSNTVLVCPGLQKGHVRIELYVSAVRPGRQV